MVGWVVRVLLIIAGLITSFFVARDALNFEIIQMVVALMLFTLFIVIITFWPRLKTAFERIMKRNH